MTAIWVAHHGPQMIEATSETAASEWAKANGCANCAAVFYAIEWPPVEPGWSKRGRKAA